MNALATDELRSALDAVLDVHRLGDLASFRTRVVDSICRLIPADGVLFATIVSPRHSSRDVEARGIEPHVVEQAIQKANHLAQAALPLLAHLDPCVQRVSDLLTHEQFALLPHYETIVRPHNFYFELDAIFFREEAPLATLSLWRREATGNFSERDRDLLHLLHPHIDVALGNCVSHARRVTSADALDEPAGSCALLFNDEGALAALSEAAEGLLRYEALRRGLPFALEIDSHLVRELGARLNARSDGRGHVRHPELGPLRFATEKRKNGMLVRVEAPAAMEQVARASEQLGLTLREVEIVRHLVTGATARQIGERLEITVNTARTHIKNIYEKLGVGNRTELVRRISPPR